MVSPPASPAPRPAGAPSPPLPFLPPGAREGWCLVALVLAVLATFGPVRTFGFVWDDSFFIRDNEALRHLSDLPRLLLQGDSAGTALSNPYFRPATTASFALGALLWGDDPAGFHAVNLLLHLLACALLLRVLLRLSLRAEAAFAGALLFALHPAHAEPVAYISARADVLATLFALASFLLYLRHDVSGSRRDLLLAVAAYLAAVCAKITAGVLPAAVLLHMALLSPKGVRLRPLALLGGATLLFLAVREAAPILDRWGEVPLARRLAAAGPVATTYLRAALFPPSLKVFYDAPWYARVPGPSALAGWALLAGIPAAALLARKRAPAAAFGVCWFFLALLPASGIVMALHPSPVANRYLYLPLAGLAIAVAAGTDRLVASGRLSRPMVVAATVAAAALLVPATRERLAPWRSDPALWRAAAVDAPGSAFVQGCLGQALLNEGSLAEAEAALERSARLGGETPDLLVARARLALARGDATGAESEARRAVATGPVNASSLNLLGVVLARQGRLDVAIHCFEGALRLRPVYPNARANLRRATADRDSLLALGEGATLRD